MGDSLRYSNNTEWADVEPLPVDDGGPEALAIIAYTEEYKEAMAYLRAVMAADEYSDRALELTAHIISLSPAHYTVWLYRAKILKQLDKPIPAEISWLNEIALRHIKNYQIWHHRQTLLTRHKAALDAAAQPFDPTSEQEFLNEMFEKDPKNYHVWSYRQWLVKNFNLWDHPTELADTERWLQDDIFNNSAWNHRWFISFGRNLVENSWVPPDALFDRELRFAEDAIALEPRNESPWNYLNGIISRSGRPLSSLEKLAQQYAVSLQDPRTIRSEHAVSLLADIYESQGRTEEAAEAFDVLGRRIDQIRHNYWYYRKTALGAQPGDGRSGEASKVAATVS